MLRGNMDWSFENSVVFRNLLDIFIILLNTNDANLPNETILGLRSALNFEYLRIHIINHIRKFIH